MSKFYQIFGSLIVAPSGGMFQVSDVRFPTKEDAKAEIARLKKSSAYIRIGSGIYRVDEIGMGVLAGTELDGVLFMEFT